MLLFETDRLRVRKFDSADAYPFFQLNSNPQTMQYIRPVKDRQACDAFLQENLQLYKQGSIAGRFAVMEKDINEVIGTFSCLYLTAEDNFHLGYAFMPDYWGKGYATELLVAGVAYFFHNTQREAVFAITEAANVASRRVLIKSGFVEKGQVLEGGKNLELFVFRKDIQLETP